MSDHIETAPPIEPDEWIEAQERERLAKLAEADGYLWAVRDDQSIEEKLEDWIRSQIKEADNG